MSRLLTIFSLKASFTPSDEWEETVARTRLPVVPDDEFQRWLAESYVPIAGREEGDEGEEGDDDDDEGEGEGSGGSGSGDEGEEGDEDDDFVRLPKAEAEALRKENAAFKRKAKEAERQTKKQREEQAAKQGKWEELASEREKEAQEARDEAEAAKFELDQYQRQVRTNSIATTLGFRDPRDAIRYLSDEDTEDDETCERALKKLARSKKYLVDDRKASGLAGGGNGGSGLTMEQIAKMSTQEIIARQDEVDKVMAGSVNGN